MEKNKFQSVAIWFIIFFLIISLSVVVYMTLKNTADLKIILEDSVRAQLISSSVAARELIDIDKFDSYLSREAIESDSEAYAQTLADLRSLQKQVGAEYIYALRQIGGKYYFIFDTDPDPYPDAPDKDDDIFDEYEGMSEVHIEAFQGKDSAGIMNVVDEWGSFNTGAIPILKDGAVIGIICTDIRDTYIQNSDRAARTNSVVLITTIIATICVIALITLLLLRHNQKLQNKLFHMAHYDQLTGLPNRQYLMDTLRVISDKSLKSQVPFAMIFIDLDNFKSVNDHAGHEAGDELLRHVASYLDKIHVHENTKSFRPLAEISNFSARIGGDEFVQIISNAGTKEEAAAAAKRVLDNFHPQAANHIIEEHGVGLSIGVALFPFHTKKYDTLIRYADIAMYHAKKNGKHSYCVYDDELQNLANGKDGGHAKDRRLYRR